MKSLLEPVPLTEEDEGVWWRVIERTARDTALGVGLSNMFHVSEESDWRDAYIMLFLESAKANGCHDTLTRMGQLHGFIGSFVRLPGIPVRDEDYA